MPLIKDYPKGVVRRQGLIQGKGMLKPHQFLNNKKDRSPG
jgi:hypothetical protein